VTDDKRPPCFDRLDAECFEKEPEWAKQAFAYRLLRLLLPEPITKRLPASLREALVAPDVIIPPGVILPPGAVFPPGSVIPPGWTPEDPMPPGVLPPPILPAAAAITGPAPPNYVAPAASEPTSQPGRAAPPAEPPPEFTENWNACTVQNYWTPLYTATAFVADNAVWKYYLDPLAPGGSQLLTYAGYIEPRTYNSASDTYLYIKDTEALRLRYLTQIKIRTRRASGAGSPLCALWDAAPPGGNLLWSEILTSSSSTTYQTWPDPGDFSGYSNLHFGFAIGLGAQRYQRLYSVEIT